MVAFYKKCLWCRKAARFLVEGVTSPKEQINNFTRACPDHLDEIVKKELVFPLRLPAEMSGIDHVRVRAIGSKTRLKRKASDSARKPMLKSPLERAIEVHDRGLSNTGTAKPGSDDDEL